MDVHRVDAGMTDEQHACLTLALTFVLGVLAGWRVKR